MRRGIVGKILVAGAAILLAGGVASASPTCTTTDNLGPSASGILAKSMFVAGFCVQAHDKLYGNFDLHMLPASTVVIFNFNSLPPNDEYQIAFAATYSNGGTAAGKHYNWSYEAEVVGAPLGTAIVELQTDFAQTAGGASKLTIDLTPAGLSAISEVKNGAITTPSSVTQTFFGPGVTDVLVTMHLLDKGTISDVTNTMVQFVPPQNHVPEPLTLALFGAGLAGLGMSRRKRRN